MDRKLTKTDEKGPNMMFLGGFAVFRGSDPNVMGTIETDSSKRFRKGLYHFCSSNGLVSAAD